MSLTTVGFLLTTALYAGFQWTIRLVVYPQFAGVGEADFAAYERQHQRRVSHAVGPLFAALVVATGALALHRPADAPWWAVSTALLLLAVILGVTGLLAVPLHRTLGAAFDSATHGRLIAVDSVRLVAAVLDVSLAVYLATR